MPEVLKLPKLSQHNRMAKMNIGGRRINAELHAQRPAERKFFAQLVFANNLRRASLEQRQGLVGLHGPASVAATLVAGKDFQLRLRNVNDPLGLAATAMDLFILIQQFADLINRHRRILPIQRFLALASVREMTLIDEVASGDPFVRIVGCVNVAHENDSAWRVRPCGLILHDCI